MCRLTTDCVMVQILPRILKLVLWILDDSQWLNGALKMADASWEVTSVHPLTTLKMLNILGG